MIDRHTFSATICNNLTDDELDNLLDRIVSNKDSDGFIFHYCNETALIYNTYNDKYVSWYKINHIGRTLCTNIDDIAELDNFILDIKNDIE